LGRPNMFVLSKLHWRWVSMEWWLSRLTVH